MGRTRTNPSTTSTDEKIEVEVAKKTDEVDSMETKNPKTEKKVFKDDEEVKIKCANFENKKVVVYGNEIAEFDDKAVATVRGAIANRLLKIPGYTLA